MSDYIDDIDNGAAMTGKTKPHLYTRCSHCGMFYQMPEGAKCPGCGKGHMI